MLFIDELLSALPVYPINEPVAIHAAFTDTDARKHGNTIALAVLLIGAIALDLGHEVATGNDRHFKMIPCLAVFKLRCDSSFPYFPNSRASRRKTGALASGNDDCL